VSRLHIRLLVQSDAFAGVERYLTYVAPELARRGHQVTVVGGEPAAMRRALAGTGVSFTPASTLADVRREAWRGPAPDVLHSHMTAADLAALGPAWARRRPLVSTLHFGGGRGHSTLTRLAYQGLRAGLTADVAVSGYVAQTSFGHPQVVTMGIPAPGLDELPPAASRRPVVLMAQRLEAEKATDVGIRAWARSGLAARGWRLEVAGRGAQRATLEALAAQLGVTDSVDFVGHDADPGARMSRSAILLAPRPDEAFGLTVVEAMARGLPVVAAGGGGHLETVGAVSADTLFPPGDVDAAARLLAGLADDESRRDALGDALAARYQATYRIDQHAERLEALYRQVVAGGRRHLRSAGSARPAVALAHDYLTQRGGAERVVVALQGAFPDAALHTTVYEPEGTFSAFRRVEVHTTALQRVGALRRNPRLALPVLASVVSRIQVDADVTVCSSTGWAHGVQTTGAKVLYIHNTARWLYQRQEYLDGLPPWYRVGLMPLAGALRRWDQRAAASADVILVNSAITQDRVLRHWGRRAEILHPPPGLTRIGAQRAVDGLEPGFLLTVSRLLPYKRIGAVLGAVRAMGEAAREPGAARATGERLVVVGSGPDRSRLEALAPPGTVFLGEVPDEQLRWLFANAEALVTAAHDDFGLTPLEAMQFGTPVVAVREGGFPETVVDGETGVLFDGATAGDVRRGLDRLRSRPWDRQVIEARAADFSAEAFAARIQAVVDDVVSRRPSP
jgi:glycosyltransferase involved in cell wall biosynthesis